MTNKTISKLSFLFKIGVSELFVLRKIANWIRLTKITKIGQDLTRRIQSHNPVTLGVAKSPRK